MNRTSLFTPALRWLAVFGLIIAAGSAVAEDSLFVVTYKQDLFAANPQGRNLPIVNAAAVEAACVAMAIAHNFQMGYAYGMDLPPGVDAWQPVAVFPSLGGVTLANEKLLADSGLGDELCPYAADAAKPLAQMIRDFIRAGGRLVICPLCWYSRGYDPADAFADAELDQNAIPGLFLSPGKSVDF